ncbi:MAG: septum formation protein Maf [Ruminococcaceae bacterium]|nr:septum formation protein Maf [Oscillospiraceae bacterium]
MLILASKSPRRKEILQGLGLNFICESPSVDESFPPRIDPNILVRELAMRKAEAVKIANSGDLVIAADTIVYHRGRILGKPKNEDDALVMLRLLSGDVHTVYTGYAVRSMYKTVCDFCATDVYFRNLDDDEIMKYIKTGEPMDKAGAYEIQGIGALLVDRIDGDYLNVVGLPASSLMFCLKDNFGFDYYGNKK